MRILIFLFIIISFILMSTEVNANSIGIGNGSTFVNINHWTEVDVIEDSDLITSIVVEGIIDKPEREGDYFDSFTIYFRPESPTTAFPKNVDVTNVSACIGRRGGHNYDNIPLFCDGDILSVSEIAKGKWWDDWTYRIDISNISEVERFAVKIDYIIPNFVIDKTPDKTLTFTTLCFPGGLNENCPLHTNIDKHIILPQDISLRDYTEGGGVSKRSDGTWRIYLEDFTPDERAKNKQYQDFVISYTDLNQLAREKRNEKLWSIFWGVLTGVIAGLIINYVFGRKNNKKIFKRFDDMEDLIQFPKEKEK